MANAVLKQQALALFEGLRAEFPLLRIDIKPVDAYLLEITVDIPQQPGLDFDVHLNLQNDDELYLCVSDSFRCSWFPSSEPAVTERYRDAVIGVLSGRYRILEYVRRGQVIGSDLEAPTGSGWTKVATSRQGLLPFTFGAKTQALQNLGAVQR